MAAIPDSRIRLINAEQNRGYVATFERALSEARGEFVLLSDQDDVWLPGRVERMIAALDGRKLVVSNCRHFDGALGSFHEIRLRAKDSTHHLRNLLVIIIGTGSIGGAQWPFGETFWHRHCRSRTT